jgi:hypothetical protein
MLWVGERERERKREKRKESLRILTYFRELALLVELPETFTELR